MAANEHSQNIFKQMTNKWSITSVILTWMMQIQMLNLQNKSLSIHVIGQCEILIKVLKKIKQDDEVEFIKQTPVHPRDRFMRKIKQHPKNKKRNR